MSQIIDKYQKSFALALDTLSWEGKPSSLYHPAEYIMSLGGKRLRPILTFIGAQLYTEDIQKAIPPALAVEIFHNFSLVHDDIMDEAPLRRGKPTVHEKWNDNIAILSGDMMLIKAYQQLEKVDNNLQSTLLPIFSKMAVEVCEGQMLDMDFEKRETVTSEEYLDMIAYKTSVLIGAAFQMGALVGGATPEDAEKLYTFGLDLGISFQIMDDYLDVYGDPEKFGKQVGGDILANKKTLLQIEAIKRAQGTSHEAELIKWMETSDQPSQKIQAVTQIYSQLGIDQYALQKAEDYYHLALEQIEPLHISDEKKSEVKAFAHWLFHRDR